MAKREMIAEMISNREEGIMRLKLIGKGQEIDYGDKDFLQKEKFDCGQVLNL